jgi:acetyl esterase/lipase
VAFLGALAAVIALVGSNVSADVQIVVRAGVEYAPGAELDAFLPADRTAPTPAVVIVHGGGWRTGSRTSWAGRASDLARRTGWATFAIDYDLERPSVQPDEVRDAIRWVQVHAADLGVDPHRVALLGSSAGGHLSMLVATTGAPIVAGVSLSGPTDLPRLERTARPDIQHLATRFVGEGDARALSPIAHVDPSDPPMFLAASADEREVPVEQLTSMRAALRAQHVPVESVVLPGTRHASRFIDDVWVQLIDFLRAHV